VFATARPEAESSIIEKISMSFAYVLLALNLLGVRQVPPGTQLHVRLLTTIGSYASHAGDPVSAVLIAPVVLNPGDATAEAILPAGAMLSGKLKSVQRVGLGFIHENAALDLDFNQISMPGGETVPLQSRVLAVENGRERVTRDGSIRGIRATNTISYRFSGYVRTAMQFEFHAAAAAWAIRALLVQVPEAELYYPAGVEFTLGLTAPIMLRTPEPSSASDDVLIAQKPVPQKLGAEQRARMEELVAGMPTRTHTAVSNRPSDLINLMFIGSREELTAAFEAAGWTQPQQSSMRANIHRIRAVAEGRGDAEAPISLLLVDGSPPDMAWQKGFNDVSKRHHIRIWKQSTTWDGREVWIGAATHDIDFAYMRPGWAITHKIEENIDREREKVVNDLAFTSCVSLVDEFKRPDFPSFAYNATGDRMTTDTGLAMLALSPCPPKSDAAPEVGAGAPSTMAASTLLPRHGSKVQRFARREVLCFRSDLLRENPYWRVYEGVRYLVSAVRSRQEHSADPDPDIRAPYQVGQTTNRARPILELLR